MEKKNPWVAAILNFVLSGLGYVYTGKRIWFGIGLVLYSVFSFVTGMTLGTQDAVARIVAGMPNPISDTTYAFFTVSYLLLCALFAYDGYKTAEEVNEGK